MYSFDMDYIALLRGINVGGNNKVPMGDLKSCFESLGYQDVSTYLNTGNVFFESDKKLQKLENEIKNALKDKFGFEIAVLILDKAKVKKIARAIPVDWQNDKEQKTDVAFLFDDIDNPEIIDELPIVKEYLDIRYVKGALIWNVQRSNINKSHLNKVVSHKYYKFMTIRNVNTTRRLASDE